MTMTLCACATLRVWCANWKNPPLFKHITILLDGHDTRATYGENKIDMYSYKLRKSGLRTQVCIDINGMAIFVSKSQSCKDHNDGTMLVEMEIGNKMQEVDCVGLDGGYTQHIGNVLEKDSPLTLANFCFPIRKKRLQPLHPEEAEFNTKFGSFRSMVESTFSELGTAFNKHNNKDPIRVVFAAFKHKKLCRLGQDSRTKIITTSRSKIIPDLTEAYTVQNKLEYGDVMLKIQEQFLGIGVEGDDDESNCTLHVFVALDSCLFHSSKFHVLNDINNPVIVGITKEFLSP